MLPDRFPVFWEEVRRRVWGWKYEQKPAIIMMLSIATVMGMLMLLMCSRSECAGFWHGLMLVQGVLAVLLAPMLAVSTFTAERQRGSLDFLFLLPISMRSIVLQKLGSAALPLLLLLLAFLPISFVSATRGQIPAGEFGAVYLLQLLRGIFYVALGLAVSSLVRHTRTSAVVTYVTIILLEYDGRMLLIDQIVPLIARHYPKYDLSLLPAPVQYLLAALLFLALAGASLGMCIGALNEQRTPRSSRMQAGRTSSGPALAHRYLPDRRAMLYYDLRHRLRAGRAYSIILGFVLMLCTMMVAFTLIENPGTDPTGWPLVGRNLMRFTLIGQLIMVLAISPGLTATLFSNERETGRFDFLILTRLTSREIVFERFWAALLPLLLAVLGGAPVLAIIAATYGGVSPLEFAGGYLLIILCGLLCAATALMCSCNAKSASSALVQGYLGALGLTALAVALSFIFCIGIPLAIYFVYFSLNRAAHQLQNARRPYYSNLWVEKRFW